MSLEKSLVFIGMFSSGKSMYGEKIAKEFGLPFFDIDVLYDNQLKKHGYGGREDFLTRMGTINYLVAEAVIMNNFEFPLSSAVVAPPGSIAYHNRDYMISGQVPFDIISIWKKSAKFIFLDTALQAIKDRNPNVNGRGVVTPNRNLQLQRDSSDFIDSLYYERKPLFMQMADITVDLQDPTLSEDDTYKKIKAALSEDIIYK